MMRRTWNGTLPGISIGAFDEEGGAKQLQLTFEINPRLLRSVVTVKWPANTVRQIELSIIEEGHPCFIVADCRAQERIGRAYIAIAPLGVYGCTQRRVGGKAILRAHLTGIRRRDLEVRSSPYRARLSHKFEEQREVWWSKIRAGSLRECYLKTDRLIGV